MKLDAQEIDRAFREACLMVHLDFDYAGAKSPLSFPAAKKRRVAIAGVLAMQRTFW
jgi:energy-coupling factor transporter ATP-binding protein EcfA2